MTRNKGLGIVLVAADGGSVPKGGMMKVKMRTLAAGPDGLYQPGQEIDLPAKQARALIEGGYAEAVEQIREVAAVEPPEKAVTPKKTRKRSSKKA
jgi:hypothetical protein